jgi:hypothetical protein
MTHRRHRWFLLEEGVISYYETEGGPIKGEATLIGTPMTIGLKGDLCDAEHTHVFSVVLGGDSPHRPRYELVMDHESEDTVWDWIYKIKSSWISPNGDTALMAIAEEGDLEELADILDAGADVNLQNNQGTTAIMACITSESEVHTR